MKKFVISVCVGLLLLGGILVSVNLDGSPQERSNVVQLEREDGTTIEGVLYAGDPRDGPGTDSPGADSLDADGSDDGHGHNGG